MEQKRQHHCVYLVDYENSAHRFIEDTQAEPHNIAVHEFFNPETRENSKVKNLPHWVKLHPATQSGKDASDAELRRFGNEHLSRNSPAHLCIVYKDDGGYVNVIRQWMLAYPRVDIRHINPLERSLASLYPYPSSGCPFCEDDEEEKKEEHPRRRNRGGERYGSSAVVRPSGGGVDWEAGAAVVAGAAAVAGGIMLVDWLMSDSRQSSGPSRKEIQEQKRRREEEEARRLKKQEREACVCVSLAIFVLFLFLMAAYQMFWKS